MRILIFLSCIFSFVLVNAQQENNYWYFGENAGLDFSTSPPTSLDDGALSSFEGCSSVSDVNGSLLFYTDGTTIWNRNHVPMPNGTGLTGNSSSAQSSLIIKDDNIPNIYYVATISVGFGLNYSIVDVSLDNGLGDIIPARKNIVIQSATQEKMTAIPNSTGYWLVTFYQGVYSAYRVGGGFIATSNPTISTVPQTQALTDQRGVLKASPDGTKLVNTSVSVTNQAFLTSFDTTSGSVSNPIPLSSSTNFTKFYGAEFSPNSQFVYLQANTSDPGNTCGANNQRQILQFNTAGTAGWYFKPIPIAGTPSFTGGRGSLQLGPDSKIYVARTCEAWLGVIQNPDLLGTNSNYLHDGVGLAQATRSREGLPNQLSFNYRITDNKVTGVVKIDADANGCDVMDDGYQNLIINFQSTDFNAFGIPIDSGLYEVNLPDGQYSITPNPENPSYWNISPASVTVDFPTQASPFTQDFCVTANGIVEDLEVFVVPLEQARPGFDTDYMVRINNKGNQTASGTVTLDYEDGFMTLLSSTPTAAQPATNQLSWSFSNLQPFQMEEYEFTMTLNTPTQATNPLNSNDILTFTGVVNGQGTDAMPADNTMIFDQTVVNSFDPNDKTCLQGETIDPVDVGEYVHYMIRFENTGTASAINVVIKDEIDLTKFDITTLVPLGGSHDYYTRIREGNIVEFIHEDINLDFNDATNDGHVLFKIKTLNTLVAGDTFDNDAGIYFDFNFPIITNNEVVTVMSTASIGESTDSTISVYPNPTNGILNINSDHSIQTIDILDLNGRMISKYDFTSSNTLQQIDLSQLGTGVYFVTVMSDLGKSTQELIVE